MAPNLRRSLSVANTIAERKTVSSGIKSVKKQPRSPKGRLIRQESFNKPLFKQSLKVILAGEKVNSTKLERISRPEDLIEILVEAHKRLGAKNIHKITATNWLGEAFHIIVERHPQVENLKNWTERCYLMVVNEYLQRKKTFVVTLNGYFKSVDVKAPFTRRVKIGNVRLRFPGEDVGNEFFDRGTLAFNSDGQYLVMPMEIKTRGAAGEIRHQLANFYKRLKEAPPGSELTYSIEGKEGKKILSLDNLVLIQDRFRLPLEEDFFRRIGVIAGKVGIFTTAKDAKGHLYIRMKLPFDTDFLRRVMEKLLRDPSWNSSQ